MRRILIPLAVMLGTAALAVAAMAATAPTVKLAHTSLGKILVNGKGFTIYVFSKDGHNKDTCAKKSGCPMTWPAVTTKSKPVAGPGLKSKLLGTIKLKHGVKQVTYAGHPLYVYSGDPPTRAATSYVDFTDFGGHWDAISPTGHVVK